MIYHGRSAVEAAEKFLGRTLDPEERRACWLEGYADEAYECTKGVTTFGMGQTGEWITKGLDAALNAHKLRVMGRFPDYPTYPEYLRKELYQAEYRGDLGHSPYTCRLICARKFEEAAEEFLESDDYRSGLESIRRRMEAVSLALSLYGHTREL